MDYEKEKLLVVQQHANLVPSHHPQNAKNTLNFPKFSTISQTTWKCKIMYLKHYPLYLGDVVTCTGNREIQSFGGGSCIMWKGWHWCALNNSWMITWMYQSQVTLGCKSRNSDTTIYNHVTKVIFSKRLETDSYTHPATYYSRPSFDIKKLSDSLWADLTCDVIYGLKFRYSVYSICFVILPPKLWL